MALGGMDPGGTGRQQAGRQRPPSYTLLTQDHTESDAKGGPEAPTSLSKASSLHQDPEGEFAQANEVPLAIRQPCGRSRWV